MKAILFDMDGTLLDSMHAWKHLDVACMEELGINPEDVDFEKLVTASGEGMIDYLQREFGVEVDVEKMNEFCRETMRQFYGREVVAKDGVYRLLDDIQELGIPMAIGTSTPGELAEIGLETTEIRKVFDFVLSGVDIGINKHDEAFFEEAARQFGVSPSDIVVFDDALLAIRAARNCGCYAVGVQDDGYEQDEDRVREEADAFVYSFADVHMPDWLEEHGLLEYRSEEE